MQKHEKQNLREAMLLHKDVSTLLADYCQAAAHVLRMSLPQVVTDSSTFPSGVQVRYSYQTLRLLAGIRSKAVELLAENSACAAAYDTASKECVSCQAQLSEYLETLKPTEKIAV